MGQAVALEPGCAAEAARESFDNINTRILHRLLIRTSRDEVPASVHFKSSPNNSAVRTENQDSRVWAWEGVDKVRRRRYRTTRPSCPLIIYVDTEVCIQLQSKKIQF